MQHMIRKIKQHYNNEQLGAEFRIMVDEIVKEFEKSNDDLKFKTEELKKLEIKYRDLLTVFGRHGEILFEIKEILGLDKDLDGDKKIIPKLKELKETR